MIGSRLIFSAACLAALALALPAGARDLGVRGATWPVAEPDLLARIEARLNELQTSGELARLQREAQQRARARIEAPERIAGIAPARERRVRVFDPAITVAQDLRTPDGTLLAAAGQRIDPLAVKPLTKDLLFIDGSREAEVEWALAHTRPATVVLLAGRPLDLARRHGRPFFFDQGGRLAARFGLAFTPSLMTQEGGRLRIDEIPLDDRDAESER